MVQDINALQDMNANKHWLHITGDHVESNLLERPTGDHRGDRGECVRGDDELRPGGAFHGGDPLPGVVCIDHKCIDQYVCIDHKMTTN